MPDPTDGSAVIDNPATAEASQVASAPGEPSTTTATNDLPSTGKKALDHKRTPAILNAISTIIEVAMAATAAIPPAHSALGAAAAVVKKAKVRITIVVVCLNMLTLMFLYRLSFKIRPNVKKSRGTLKKG